MKIKKSKDSIQEHEHDDDVDQLADRIIDSMKDNHKTDLEPFEMYTQRLKSSFHLNVNQFKNRFIKGYSVLCEEMEKHQEDHQN